MLDAYRRQTAEFLELLNERLAVAADAIIDAGAYPSFDDLLSDYADYLTTLFSTVASLDGDVNPDEMVVMLFQGMERFSTGDDYLASINRIKARAASRGADLLVIPPFLAAAAECDRQFGTAYAADIVNALLGMAETLADADMKHHPRETRFLEGYERLLEGYLRRNGLDASDDANEAPPALDA